MKTIFRFLTAFFAMFMLCLCSVANAAGAESHIKPIKSAVATEATPVSVVLTKEQPSAFRAWVKKDTAFKKANPWTKVWKQNSARLNIPMTDEAWKHVGPGTTFHLSVNARTPTVQESIAVVRSEIASEQQQLKAMDEAVQELKIAVHNAEADLAEVRAELVATKKTLADRSTYLLSATIGLIGFTGLFLAYIFTQSKKIKQQHKEIFAQKRRIKELEASNRAAHHLVAAYESEVARLNHLLSSHETKMTAMKQLLKECDPNGDCGAPELPTTPVRAEVIPLTSYKTAQSG